MAIQFACSACGRKLRADDTQIGKRFACPACKSPVTVPGPVAQAITAAAKPLDDSDGTKRAPEAYGERSWSSASRWLIVSVAGVILVIGAIVGVLLWSTTPRPSDTSVVNKPPKNGALRAMAELPLAEIHLIKTRFADQADVNCTRPGGSPTTIRPKSGEQFFWVGCEARNSFQSATRLELELINATTASGNHFSPVGWAIGNDRPGWADMIINSDLIDRGAETFADEPYNWFELPEVGRIEMRRVGKNVTLSFPRSAKPVPFALLFAVPRVHDNLRLNGFAGEPSVSMPDSAAVANAGFSSTPNGADQKPDDSTESQSTLEKWATDFATFDSEYRQQMAQQASFAKERFHGKPVRWPMVFIGLRDFDGRTVLKFKGTRGSLGLKGEFEGERAYFEPAPESLAKWTSLPQHSPVTIAGKIDMSNPRTVSEPLADFRGQRRWAYGGASIVNVQPVEIGPAMPISYDLPPPSPEDLEKWPSDFEAFVRVYEGLAFPTVGNPPRINDKAREVLDGRSIRWTLTVSENYDQLDPSQEYEIEKGQMPKFEEVFGGPGVGVLSGERVLMQPAADSAAQRQRVKPGSRVTITGKVDLSHTLVEYFDELDTFLLPSPFIVDAAPVRIEEPPPTPEQ